MKCIYFSGLFLGQLSVLFLFGTFLVEWYWNARHMHWTLGWTLHTRYICVLSLLWGYWRSIVSSEFQVSGILFRGASLSRRAVFTNSLTHSLPHLLTLSLTHSLTHRQKFKSKTKTFQEILLSIISHHGLLVRP